MILSYAILVEKPIIITNAKIYLLYLGEEKKQIFVEFNYQHSTVSSIGYIYLLDLFSSAHSTCYMVIVRF